MSEPRKQSRGVVEVEVFEHVVAELGETRDKLYAAEERLRSERTTRNLILVLFALFIGGVFVAQCTPRSGPRSDGSDQVAPTDRY